MGERVWAPVGGVSGIVHARGHEPPHARSGAADAPTLSSDHGM